MATDTKLNDLLRRITHFRETMLAQDRPLSMKDGEFHAISVRYIRLDQNNTNPQADDAYADLFYEWNAARTALLRQG